MQGFQRITELSSLGLKSLNDQLEMLWLKVLNREGSKNSGAVTTIVDTVNDDNNIGSYFLQTDDTVKIAVGALGQNNLVINGDATRNKKAWTISNGTLSSVVDTYEICRQVFEVRSSGVAVFSQSGIICNPSVKHTFSFKGMLLYPASKMTAYVRGKKTGTSDYYVHKSVQVNQGSNYSDYYVTFDTYSDESELEVIFTAEMASPFALFYVTDIQIKEGSGLTAYSKNNSEFKTNILDVDSIGLYANVNNAQIEQTNSRGDTNLLIKNSMLGAVEVTSPSIATLGKSILANSINLYVATTGNDDNVGTQAYPFRTIQKAIDSLPLLSEKTMNIYLAAGTYFEDVTIYVQNKTINIYAYDSLLIGRVEIYNSGYIYIERLRVQTTEGLPCIYLKGAGLTTFLEQCIIDGVSRNKSGVACEKGAKAYFDYTNFFNCNNAISINQLSMAFYFECKGNNNNYSLYSYGGIIMGGGSCPNASTMAGTQYGGKIYYDSASMSSATCPFSTVSTYKWETPATSTACLINNSFDSAITEVVKGKIKRYTDAVKSAEYGEEREGLWFFDNESITSNIGTKTIYGAKFTVKRASYGGTPKPTKIAFFLHNITSTASLPTFYDTGVRTTIAWGQEQSVFLPADIASYIKNGTYKGIAIKALSDDEDVAILCPQSEYTAKLMFYYR